jgi:purine-binding chemotaxis protein CheW
MLATESTPLAETSPAVSLASPRSAPQTSSLAPTTQRIHAAGEFLSFKLGAEEYGIDILTVQEIRSYEQPTRIANAPDFIKGVVNLRGVIVPLVDLRMKFGLSNVAYDDFTVVIVLNVARRVVGVVVDAVSDVVQLVSDQIKPTPHFSGAVDVSFITGIGSVQGRMMILMDIESLIRSADMGLMDLDA